jgi:hypothetical protein
MIGTSLLTTGETETYLQVLARYWPEENRETHIKRQYEETVPGLILRPGGLPNTGLKYYLHHEVLMPCYSSGS